MLKTCVLDNTYNWWNLKFLVTLSMLTVYSIDDNDNECGAVGRVRIGKGNWNLRENPFQYNFVHHKSPMTWSWIEPQLLWWEESE